MRNTLRLESPKYIYIFLPRRSLLFFINLLSLNYIMIKKKYIYFFVYIFLLVGCIA
jgi:hypothetical protein